MAKANAPATEAGLTGKVQGLYRRIQAFFQDVLAEFKKVTWPSREELRSSTTIVLILLVLLAAIVGAADLVFRQVVLKLLTIG